MRDAGGKARAFALLAPRTLHPESCILSSTMPELEIAIPRPQRWDEPFGDMTERDVDQLAADRAVPQHRRRARFRRRCRCAAFCWAIRGSCSYEPGDVDRPRRRLRQQCVPGSRGRRARGARAARSETARAVTSDRSEAGCGPSPSFGGTRQVPEVRHDSRFIECGRRHERAREERWHGPRVRAGCAAAASTHGHGAAGAWRNLRRAGGYFAHAADRHRSGRWPGDAAGNPLAGPARSHAADARDSRARRAAVSREQLARSSARNRSCCANCRRKRWTRSRPRPSSNRTATSIGTPISAPIVGGLRPNSSPPSR